MVSEQYAILSDIHGNLTALRKAMSVISQYNILGIVLLGDIIDYGPRSNEVIEYLKTVEKTYDIPINIWGNHERAVLQEDYEHFSSERGVKSAQYTGMKLTEESVEYLMSLDQKGYCEFEIGNRKVLAVHGSLKDFFWKSIDIENISEDYKKYDYVFSGHSHIPHYFSKYWETDAPLFRNKCKTVFINPGSIGQPRDLNNCLSFALLNIESGECTIKREKYDIVSEQSFYDGSIDEFYRTRIERGI